MTSSDKGFIICLIFFMICLTVSVSIIFVFFSFNSLAKFEIATKAGLEQQQRLGTDSCIWAYPKTTGVE